MHPLDHPLWSSLTTLHRPLALGAGGMLRYPVDIAPFLAAPGNGSVSDAALATLVPPGDEVYLVGPAPEVPRGWRLDSLGEIVQMICDAPIADAGSPEVVPLGEHERPAVVELAALVYPRYFRPRTTALGRYFGIFDGGRLAAMIGERMGMPGLRELSAVCTHPDFTGRGLARRLLAYLGNDLLARGTTPFLHVSPDNLRARRLYEQNGYRTRRTLAFWSLYCQPSS
jgi:ribosomal protein S18 acetylase RimI-like enzyme